MNKINKWIKADLNEVPVRKWLIIAVDHPTMGKYTTEAMFNGMTYFCEHLKRFVGGGFQCRNGWDKHSEIIEDKYVTHFQLMPKYPKLKN